MSGSDPGPAAGCVPAGPTMSARGWHASSGAASRVVNQGCRPRARGAGGVGVPPPAGQGGQPAGQPAAAAGARAGGGLRFQISASTM